MYFVYILQCCDDTFYTGITTDVNRRFQEHKNGEGGHYTRARKAVEILYTEEHDSRSSALKREAEIKKLSKDKKIFLVKNTEHKTDF